MASPASPVASAADAAAAASPSLLELSSSLGKIGLNENSSAVLQEAMNVARDGKGLVQQSEPLSMSSDPFNVVFNRCEDKHAVQSPAAVSEIDQEYDDELNYSEDEAAAAAEQPAKKKKNDVSKPIYARANGFQRMHQSADIARACICCCPHC